MKIKITVIGLIISCALIGLGFWIDHSGKTPRGSAQTSQLSIVKQEKYFLLDDYWKIELKHGDWKFNEAEQSLIYTGKNGWLGNFGVIHITPKNGPFEKKQARLEFLASANRKYSGFNIFSFDKTTGERKDWGASCILIRKNMEKGEETWQNFKTSSPGIFSGEIILHFPAQIELDIASIEIKYFD